MLQFKNSSDKKHICSSLTASILLHPKTCNLPPPNQQGAPGGWFKPLQRKIWHDTRNINPNPLKIQFSGKKVLGVSVDFNTLQLGFMHGLVTNFSSIRDQHGS
jgi:hypothetical protein